MVIIESRSAFSESFVSKFSLHSLPAYRLHWDGHSSTAALVCLCLIVTPSLPCGFSNGFMSLGFLPKPRDKLLMPGRSLTVFTHLFLAQRRPGHTITALNVTP